MNTYTIVVSLSGVVVLNGIAKGARRKYYAPGLEIFVKGRVNIPARDKVHYHAMSLARAHHIPLISLHSEGWV